MTQRHPDLFEVLIGQIGQDGKADVVLGKSLRVLPETELLKPVSTRAGLLATILQCDWCRLAERLWPHRLILQLVWLPLLLCGGGGMLFWASERTNDLSLSMSPHGAVAGKCRQHVLVAEVLRPSLVLLWRLADLAAE
jgi:hypothetical protein